VRGSEVRAADTRGALAAPRVDAIDFLKAAAIVTVIYIHGVGDPFDLARLPWAAYLTSWAVPAFFFASGFLHQRDLPLDAATRRRWTRRLLVPYAIASVLAIAVRAGVRGESLGWRDALFMLTTGSAWGIYYFVPVLFGALLVTPLLARFPRAVLPLALVFWAAPLGVALGVDPVYHRLGLFWLLRSPLTWWGYFLAGWMVARHRAALAPGVRRAAGVAGLLLLAGVGSVCTVPGVCRDVLGPTLYVANYGAIAALFVLGAELPALRVARFLADASYPVYLYHFFFTDPVRAHGGRLGGWTKPAAFAAGTAGALLVVGLGRALLGRRARDVIG
jgi:surface polysaccharide O-acyltransferase-like enzyme